MSNNKVIEKIQQFIINDSILSKYNVYLDNILSTTYFLNLKNNTDTNTNTKNIYNKINLYCVINNLNDIVYFKKINDFNEKYNDKTHFKINNITTNYSNTQNLKINKLSKIELIYLSENINDTQVPVIIYFLKTEYEIFNGKINQNNAFMSNPDAFTKNLYYLLNDNNFYLVFEDNISQVNLDNVKINYDDINLNIQMFYDNYYTLFETIYIYLLTSNNFFKKMLDEIISIYIKENKIKKKIKAKFNFHNSDYVIKLSNFMNSIWYNCLEHQFLILLKEYEVLNNILFELKKVNYYSYTLDAINLEIYMKIIIMNKMDLVNSKYLNYAKKYLLNMHSEHSEHSKQLALDENITSLIPIDYNFDYNFDFNFLFSDDKLNIYKSFENIKIKSEIYHYFEFINNSSFIYFCKILSVLFYYPKKTNHNIETIKYAYIYKKYGYFGKNSLKCIFDFYNNVLDSYNLNYCICEENYIYDMITSYNLVKYEMEVYLKLEQYKYNQLINIIDFQDIIGLTFELVYLNKLDLSDYDNVKIICDGYLNSVLENTKSNKFFLNDNQQNILFGDMSEYTSNDIIFDDFILDDNLIDFNVLSETNIYNKKDKKNTAIITYDMINEINENSKHEYLNAKKEYNELKIIHKIILTNYFNVNICNTNILSENDINNIINLYIINENDDVNNDEKDDEKDDENKDNEFEFESDSDSEFDSDSILKYICDYDLNTND